MKGSFPCPQCGASVPAKARSCRECGSDAETGWKEDAEVESVELPEGELSREDYESFLAREGLGPGRRRRLAWWPFLLGGALALGALLYRLLA